MVSSGLLRRVALVRTDVSEEFSASFIRVTRIGELGTTLALTSNTRTLRRNIRLRVRSNVVPSSQILVTLMKDALSSSETSVITRATRRNITEDTILRVLGYHRIYIVWVRIILLVALCCQSSCHDAPTTDFVYN
jgi:hypothetical protein